MSVTKGRDERFSESEVKELLTGEFFKKKFLKKKCGQCGVACFRAKFGDTSPLIVRAQTSSFWCKDCGRLLCEAHRVLHECERVDAKRAAERRLSPEEIRERALRKEKERVDREEEEKQKVRAQRDLKTAKYQFWKARRSFLAGKSNHVVNFAQRLALSSTEQGRARDELLELYTTCNRINLRLWNDVTEPTCTDPPLDMESNDKLVTSYDRIKEITGMVCIVDGMPLDLSLPDGFLSASSAET